MSDDEYQIPLLDQRYFGAGIKRKRIHFVPSTTANSKSIPQPNTSSAADRYLSIVLGQSKCDEDLEVKGSEDGPKSLLSSNTTEEDHHELPTTKLIDDVDTNVGFCKICQKPLMQDKEHDRSLIHQICLKHSHPPSHLDRSSKALGVLRSQGWDPDSRKGLGATGQGILHPIKTLENPQRAGLGATVATLQATPKPVRLDAGKIQKLDRQAQKDKAKLRAMFYQSEALDKYLGEDV